MDVSEESALVTARSRLQDAVRDFTDSVTEKLVDLLRNRTWIAHIQDHDEFGFYCLDAFDGANGSHHFIVLDS
jgi:hypothetical protein